jgi:hypothetical protein
MDAGRIKSFTPNVNLRADAGPEQHSSRRSDAGEIAAKLAPFLLDAAARSAEAIAGADLTAERLPPIAPRSGVVVQLSIPLLTAGKALELARALPNPADYNHLDPRKSAARPDLGARIEASPERAEPLTSASVLVAAGVSAIERNAAPPSSSSNLPASPDLRPDLQAHLNPAVVMHQNQISAAEQKTAASAVSQARDTERLAGLAVPPEPRVSTTQPHLGKLVIGAIVLAVLVFVLL